MGREVTPAAELNLAAINNNLADKTPEQIIEWAANTFDHDKIFSLTSAGLSAPLTLDLLYRTAKAGISPDIAIIHNDTGFLPDQVYEYRDKVLEPAFEFESIVCGPSNTTVNYIEETRLWSQDKNLYRKLTKQEPVGEAIRRLGAQVIITGVRHDQTENRQDLDVVTYGADGEIRVNPNYWTPTNEVEERLERLISEKRVARHPLYLVVDFVDDWPFVGGTKEECTLNSADRLVVTPSFKTVKSA